MIDRDHHENEERRRNQEKLIKEEEVKEIPAPHFPEVPDSMIGIQKVGISEDLWRVLQPTTLKPLKFKDL